MPLLRSVLFATVSLTLATSALRAQATIPAFPGAEGFAAFSNGGRGGDVYYVTNLNASGAGSFADAIATVPTAGRTIVFAVSGYIRFPSGSNGTRMTKGKVTIAGQTAPGDGIGFYNNFFRVSAPDVVIRHIRFRHGKNGSGGDCLDLDSGANRAMLDHLSMQFSTDENMSSFSSAPDRLTLQYSINSWGLQSHSAGGLWDQNYATSLYNLWAHNHTRNPKARPWGLLEWINNVTYDWNIGFIMGDSETPATWKANVIGNYFLCPPGNLRSVALQTASLDRNGNPNFTLHVADNLFDKNGNTLLDGTDYGFGVASGAYATSVERMTAAGGGIVAVPPRLAFKKVVSSSGALRLNATSGLTLRDEVDTHQFDNVLNFRRNIITRESDLPVSNAGFGVLNSAPAPLDSDRDGMSDAYESALGWTVSTQDHNTALPSVGGLISGTTFLPAGSPAGYTRLEEYLHFLASPHAIVARNTASDPSALTVDLSRYTLGFNAHTPVFTVAKVVGGTTTQSGSGGRLVTFTPTLNLAGRARFEFTVTDAQGDSWTQSFLILLSAQGVPRNLVWKGDGSANAWNTAALNWTKPDGESVAFAPGDNALFDDRGSATPSLALAANLATGPVTFDTTQNYTLAGAGALTVGGPLTKRGPGSLTLANTGATSFGSVIHEEGGLVLTKSNSAGGAKIQLQGGTLTLSPDVTGSNVTNALEFNAPTVVNVTTQHNSTGAWTGPGDITVNTSALWTIAGSWSGYSGRITLGSTGTPRLRLNQTSNTNFGSAALAIDLGQGSGQFMNRNGGTTPYAIGTLTGGPNTQLQGTQTPNANNDNTSTYSVGARGENAVFEGSIRNGGSTAAVATLITKVGGGTWTLTGASTHTGLTTVSAGTLRLDGSFSAAPITVASGAVLAGSGSTGGLVTVQSGGRLSPGAGDLAAGTFTTAGLNPASGSTLSFDLAPTPAGASDRLTVDSGTLTLAGTINVQLNFLDLAQGVGAGTYPLIDGAATLSATSPTLTAVVPAPAGTTRQTFSLIRPASGANPAYVHLVVSGAAAPLVWSGPAGGTWDLNTTSGNFSGGPTSTFYNLDRVTLDDTGPGGLVTLAGALQPARLTIHNTDKAYTLGGSGVLSGPMTLVKTGAGAVTFTTSAAHTYTGGVELHAGSLILGSAVSPFGPGLIRIHGGTLQLANASTFLTNSFLFSGSSALVSPYTGNSTLANSTANTFASTGPDTVVNLSGIAGIISLNGRMDGFAGTLDWGAGSGMLRLNANSSGASDVNLGSAAAHFALGSAAGRLVNRNGGLVIDLGAVSGGPSTLLSGRQTGAGESATTYRVGALGLDTVFAGAIQNGGDLAGVQIVKVGTGTWTLAGASEFVGSLDIEAGRIELSGSLACTGAARIASAGTLRLSGGLLQAEALELAPSARLEGLGHIRADVANRGEIRASGPGVLTIEGDVVNDGLIRLTAGASLAASGAFINNGVLDLMTAGGALPANLVNNGIVIDASAARLSSWQRDGTAFTLRIPSHTGYVYTLQTSTDVAAGWTAVETRPGSTGQDLVFTHDAGPSARRFYRIHIE